MPLKTRTTEKQLKTVSEILIESLSDTGLSHFLPPKNNILGSGKLLRARLTLTVGNHLHAEEETLLKSAAAIEMIHGASLLHDDVIDCGLLRRGAPTFWKQHGTNGAILLGDLIVFKALQLFSDGKRNDLLHELIAMAGLVCQAEAGQELIQRGKPKTNWADCETTARNKTGSLFAFAALAGAPQDAEDQKKALKDAGFTLGTAYQLADDLLDASDYAELAGKTLGQDAARGKQTAVGITIGAPPDPVRYIEDQCKKSASSLSTWPKLHTEWCSFIDKIIQPTLNHYLH